jgi:hypothetical protein
MSAADNYNDVLWEEASPADAASTTSNSDVDSSAGESPTAVMSLAMDPLFAVSLQEAFGPPLDDTFLQLLTTEEILAAEIPIALARQIFQHWRRSLQARLCAKPDFVEVRGGAEVPPVVLAAAGGAGRRATREEMPRTVLAPNAVAYYESQDLDRALRESSAMSEPKKVSHTGRYPTSHIQFWVCIQKQLISVLNRFLRKR